MGPTRADKIDTTTNDDRVTKYLYAYFVGGIPVTQEQYEAYMAEHERTGMEE